MLLDWPLLLFFLLLCLEQCSGLAVPNKATRNDVMTRRAAVVAAASSASLLFVPSSSQAAETSNVFHVQPFTFDIPSSWKLLVQPNKKSLLPGPKSTIFSAIDFDSGAVLTVVQERACSVADYVNNADACDFVLSSSMLVDDTSKFVSKLLIRHDDRVNAALQGTTVAQSYELINENNGLELFATTTIPTGGTYRDTMGLDRPNTILRPVRAKAVVAGDDRSTLYSIWLSATADEWRKPVAGTKLLQIWSGIQIDGVESATAGNLV